MLKDPLVWIDLEMTGLNLRGGDVIMEAAVIVTDGQLEEGIEGPEIVIHCTDAQLDGMDEWCTEHHGQSGLTQRCRESNVTMADAEKQLLDFVTKFVPEKRRAVLAGNSIHVDKTFIDAQMPALSEHLHYRLVDVSSVKELAKRWYPAAEAAGYAKQNTHRAMDDIRESIGELKYYRSTFFK